MPRGGLACKSRPYRRASARRPGGGASADARWLAPFAGAPRPGAAGAPGVEPGVAPGVEPGSAGFSGRGVEQDGDEHVELPVLPDVLAGEGVAVGGGLVGFAVGAEGQVRGVGGAGRVGRPIVAGGGAAVAIAVAPRVAVAGVIARVAVIPPARRAAQSGRPARAALGVGLGGLGGGEVRGHLRQPLGVLGDLPRPDDLELLDHIRQVRPRRAGGAGGNGEQVLRHRAVDQAARLRVGADQAERDRVAPRVGRQRRLARRPRRGGSGPARGPAPRRSAAEGSAPAEPPAAARRAARLDGVGREVARRVEHGRHVRPVNAVEPLDPHQVPLPARHGLDGLGIAVGQALRHLGLGGGHGGVEVGQEVAPHRLELRQRRDVADELPLALAAVLDLIPVAAVARRIPRDRGDVVPRRLRPVVGALVVKPPTHRHQRPGHEQRRRRGEPFGLVPPHRLAPDVLGQQAAGDGRLAHRLQRQPVGTDDRQQVLVERRRLLRVARRAAQQHVDLLDLQLQVLLQVLPQPRQLERAAQRDHLPNPPLLVHAGVEAD